MITINQWINADGNRQIKANFRCSDIKPKYSRRCYSYLREYFLNWTGSWQFFSSAQLWSRASKWPLHSWLLSVKCLHCFCLALVSIELKMQKRPPQLQHVYKQVTLSCFLLLLSPVMIEAFCTSVCEAWTFLLQKKKKIKGASTQITPENIIHLLSSVIHGSVFPFSKKDWLAEFYGKIS